MFHVASASVGLAMLLVVSVPLVGGAAGVTANEQGVGTSGSSSPVAVVTPAPNSADATSTLKELIESSGRSNDAQGVEGSDAGRGDAGDASEPGAEASESGVTSSGSSGTRSGSAGSSGSGAANSTGSGSSGAGSSSSGSSAPAPAPSQPAPAPAPPAPEPAPPACPAAIGGSTPGAPGRTSAQGVGGTTSSDLQSFAERFNAIRVANCLPPVPLSNIRYDSCMEDRLFWMAEDPSTDPMSAWGHIGSQRSDGVASVGCDGNLAGGSNNSGSTVAQKWWDSSSHRSSLYKPTYTGSTAGVCILFAMTHGGVPNEPYSFTRAAARWVNC